MPPRIRCNFCLFVLFFHLMHVLSFCSITLSWCMFPFAVLLLSTMSCLISSFPSLISSFLLFCDLGTSPVISAFSFVAAAFASSPGFMLLHLRLHPNSLLLSCDFCNGTSFRLLQHCRRLSHFRLLCGSCSFGSMLDFSFEFSVALFKHFYFTRSHFCIVLTLKMLLLLGCYSFRCMFFVRIISSMLWHFVPEHFCGRFTSGPCRLLQHLCCNASVSCLPICSPTVSLHLSVSCM